MNKRSLDGVRVTQPIVVNTISFLGHTFETACCEIAKLPCSYVEPCLIASYDDSITDAFFTEHRAAEYRSTMKRYNLSSFAVGAHMDLGVKSAVSSFVRRMEFARALGCQYVHTNSTSRDKEQQFYRNIELLVPTAEQLGIIITLENPGDHGDNIMPDNPASAAVIRNIGSPWVRLNFDPSNIVSYSQGRMTPTEGIEEIIPLIAHVHLKEFDADAPGHDFIAIGSGNTDYRQLLTLLLSQTASMPMSIELPLSYCRDNQFAITRKSVEEHPDLRSISITLKKSLTYIEHLLTEVHSNMAFDAKNKNNVSNLTERM